MTRWPARTTATVGVALIVLGVLAYLGHLRSADHGSSAFDRDPVAPASVTVTAGKSYLISTVDGPTVPPTAAGLTCGYRTPDAGAANRADASLPVTALGADSRATHAVASFVAPVTGRIAVTCNGGTVGARTVFVDDADDAGVDVAGWLLIVAVALFLVGAGVTLTGVRGLIATRG